MLRMFLRVLNLCVCFKVCCPFRILKQYQCNLQEKKVWVPELIPMDLFGKAKEIAVISLLILYNINPMPLVICGPPLAANFEHGLGAKEELQEEDTYVLTRRKTKMRKVACNVVIKEVNMRMNNGNLLILKSS